jgi:N-acetyl-gamma-glutamyl-phosphate reductase
LTIIRALNGFLVMTRVRTCRIIFINHQMVNSERLTASFPMEQKSIALLHGAGYVGGELIRLLVAHPQLMLAAVTSRTFAGQPLWAAHPHLRDMTDLVFSEEAAPPVRDAAVVLVCAEHGQGATAVRALLEAGYQGQVIDLSTDFRLRDARQYPAWLGFEHPAPDLLPAFRYSLPELHAPFPTGTRFVANPGCFATGLTLALWPLAQHLPRLEASVTALTGASGSGTRPGPTTHFPTREGNVRAYKVMAHQHQAEVLQTLGTHVELAFVPVSGPWTRGIWGTAHLALPDGLDDDTVAGWFEAACPEGTAVRLWPRQLPELRYAVGTPYCDLGWVVQGRHLVVGFALDNLLKGAASQAVQNLNLLLGLPMMTGLVPGHSEVSMPG